MNFSFKILLIIVSLSFLARKKLTELFDSLYGEKKLSEICFHMSLLNWLLNFFPNSRANCLKANTTLSVSGPSSSREQLRNKKVRILLPYNKFDRTFEVLPDLLQFPSLFQVTSECNIPILPEEGWFGQPKYSTRSKNILRCVGLCLYTLSRQCSYSKNVSYFAVNALKSRHNIKSLFESSGKSGLLSSHAVFCSMKRLLIFIVVPEWMSEHHMVTPPLPPIVLIHCFYKECYLIDLMVR